MYERTYKNFYLNRIISRCRHHRYPGCSGCEYVYWVSGEGKDIRYQSNHKTIVQFITVSVARCSIGDELILKYSYDLNTKKFTYTKDLCPYVNSGNASYMAGAFVYHFKSPVWCNPMGWKHNSGTCMEAAETSGTVGEGTPGATKFITSSGSPSTLTIDTKYTCEPLALTETCRQGKSLTDSIKIE